jgi:hypothetical protein
MKIQRRLKISRASLSNRVSQAVRREVEHTAKKFGVSKSFVQADFFGITIEERYDEPRLKIVEGGKKSGRISRPVHRRQSRAGTSAERRRVS